MQKFNISPWLLFLSLGLTASCFGSGTLQGPVRISSESLGYDLQYWVYLPELEQSQLPELYFTDGGMFLSAGNMVEILDEEIASGRIAPVAAIFVDSRNPDQLSVSRRNEEFMCNKDYGKFFLGELIPAVSATWTGADENTRRGLAGVSFGAINAACFGLMMPTVFKVLMLFSPGSDKHIEVVRKLYEERPRQPYAFFLSHGGRFDNARAAGRFAHTLEEKGYPLRYVTNNGRHDWDNWLPLMDDSLRAFIGLGEGDRL